MNTVGNLKNPQARRGVLFFPDILEDRLSARTGLDVPTDDDVENDVADAFFELANSPLVGYRLGGNAIDPSEAVRHVVVSQNNSVQEHTGGIVWETSYLLASYLLCRHQSTDDSSSAFLPPLGKVLDIGSGCGMLGLVLAISRLAQSVVLSEAPEVMKDLTSNVERNAKTNEDLAGAVSARRLDWTDLDADIKAAGDDLRPHSFDTIVGTDVVFAKSLVAPLLGCLARMAHKKSRIYLCLQVRCEDAHAMLLRSAKRFGLRIEDCSDELRKMPSCSWGIDLECKLLRIAVEKTLDDSVVSERARSGMDSDREQKKVERKRSKCNGVTTADESNKMKRKKKERRKKERKKDREEEEKCKGISKEIRS